MKTLCDFVASWAAMRVLVAADIDGIGRVVAGAMVPACMPALRERPYDGIQHPIWKEIHQQQIDVLHGPGLVLPSRAYCAGYLREAGASYVNGYC